MPLWMSHLPIGRANISAATAAEFDAAASITAVAVHGLSATSSGPLRRKKRSLSTLLTLVWLLLVSYRLGSRFRGFPVFVTSRGCQFHASAALIEKCSEAAATNAVGTRGANLPEAAPPRSRVCPSRQRGHDELQISNCPGARYRAGWNNCQEARECS